MFADETITGIAVVGSKHHPYPPLLLPASAVNSFIVIFHVSWAHCRPFRTAPTFLGTHYLELMWVTFYSGERVSGDKTLIASFVVLLFFFSRIFSDLFGLVLTVMMAGSVRQLCENRGGYREEAARRRRPHGELGWEARVPLFSII